jgi:phage-related protein
MERDYAGNGISTINFASDYDKWFEQEQVYNMEGNMNPFNLEPPVEQKKIRRLAASAARQVRAAVVSLRTGDDYLQLKNA